MADPSSAGPDRASRFWWRWKVLAGSGLIFFVFQHFLTLSTNPGWLAVPLLLAQGIVVVGGLLTLWHAYLLAGSGNKNGSAKQLVCSGGLYPLVRHPMYLGDMVLYLGLALLAPGWGSGICLLLGWSALILQARAEDAYLSARFGSDFDAWASRTGRILPIARKL